jgi:hypothetical protein
MVRSFLVGVRAFIPGLYFLNAPTKVKATKMTPNTAKYPGRGGGGRQRYPVNGLVE